MMGTSYNGTLPEAVSTTGVDGPGGDRADLGDLDWYDYYRANGMVAGARTPSRARTSTCWPTPSTRARTGRSASGDPQRDHERHRPGHRRLQRRSGTTANTMQNVRNVHAAALIAHGEQWTST